MQKETVEEDYNGIGKYVAKHSEYANLKNTKLKISSDIRDIVPMLLPLEGNGELSEEEMTKFALGQDMIKTGKNRDRKAPDNVAKKEELLVVFNEFLPIFRERVNELLSYKERFPNLCGDDVSVTDVLKMDKNDLRLLPYLSKKAQAVGYTVARILGNPTLVANIPEDTLNELMNGWNAISPLQRLFGESAVSHYNNICSMTANELISNGYKAVIEPYRVLCEQQSKDHAAFLDKAKQKAAEKQEKEKKKLERDKKRGQGKNKNQKKDPQGKKNDQDE